MMKFGIRKRNKLFTAILFALFAASLGGCGQDSPLSSGTEKASGVIEHRGDLPVKTESVPPAGVPYPVAAGSDAALTTRVKLALGDDPVLKTYSLDISVSQGIVTLFGTVDTMSDRIKAGDLALNVPGVQSVRNNIQLAKDA
jgi:hypothetical protein